MAKKILDWKKKKGLTQGKKKASTVTNERIREKDIWGVNPGGSRN